MSFSAFLFVSLMFPDKTYPENPSMYHDIPALLSQMHCSVQYKTDAHRRRGFFEKLSRNVLTTSTINCCSLQEGKQPNIYRPHPSFKLTGGERLLPRKQRPWAENCIALNQRRLLWCRWTLDRTISRLWICCITLDLKPIRVHKNLIGPAQAVCTVA